MASSTFCRIIAAVFLLFYFAAAADPRHNHHVTNHLFPRDHNATTTSHVFPPGFNVTTFNSLENATSDNIFCGGLVSVMVGQGEVGYNGQNMPVFLVQIFVFAPSTFRHGIYNLRLNCGEFSSYNLILPSIFERQPEGYCLVKGGRFIRSGGLVSFRYAQIMPQPLSVLSYDC